MNIDARNLANNNLTTTTNQNETRQLIRSLNHKPIDPAYLEPQVIAPLEKAAIAGAPARTDSLNVSKVKIITTKCAYDLDYDKDKSLENSWNFSTGSLAWLRSAEPGCQGFSGRVSDEAVRGMSKDEFADYMKTHELDKTIDWFDTKQLFGGHNSYSDFVKQSDYTAALYATLEDRIKTDFSGEEQAEQMNKLNELYNNSVDLMVKGFTESNVIYCVEGTFEKLGVPLPEGKLEESIRAVMDSKTAEYRKYVANHDDYAGIKNTDDKWMRRDVGFMAASLIKAYDVSGASADDDKWSEDDIVTLGMLGSMYAHEAQYKGQGSVLDLNDEESIGMAISMTWLATERILSDRNASEDVRNIGNKLFEAYSANVIDRADRVMANARKNAVGHTDAEFTDINADDVFGVVVVVKDSYSQSSGAEKAIHDMTKFACEQFLKKAKTSNQWRYNNPYAPAGTGSKGFWEGFYNSEPKTRMQGGMKSVLKTWEKFDKIMQSGDLDAFCRNISTNTFRNFRSDAYTAV